MKKKKWILPIIVIASAIILCLAAVLIFDAVLNAQGYSVSVGRLYYADNGTYLINGEGSPMLVLDCTDNAELFKGYQNGDKIVLFHDGVDGSYPARTGGYRIVRLSKGNGDYKPPNEVLGHSSKETPYLPFTQNVGFDVQYIRTNMPNYNADFPIVTAIHSKDELTAYYDTNKDKLGLGNQNDSFRTAMKKYDAAFFENNALVFVVLEEGSGSTSHNVEAVKIDGDGNLHIDIHSINPEVGTCDMAYWHIMLAIPKDIAPDGSEDIVVYYNDKVIYDQYSYGPETEEQMVQSTPSGYCGNTQTTIYFEDMKTGTTKSFTFMGGESVTMTDILVKLDYDKKKMCKCMAEYSVQTEFGKYSINISDSYARSSEGQAELTGAQTQSLSKIIEWAREKAK